MKKYLQHAAAVCAALAFSSSTVPGCAAAGTAGSAAPATQNPAVQLNGSNLVFPDAKPLIQNGRTFMPFRAVFEALGAEVSYDSGTVTAVRNGRTITMSIGSTQVKILENDVERIITMDVAPYIDASTGRTFVPLRFAAQALDCTVGWDAEAYTAIVIDPQALIQGESFTYLEQLAKYTEKYNEGMWETNLVFSGSMDIMNGFSCPIQGSAAAGTENGEKMDMTMNMKMDMTNLVKSVAPLGQLAGTEEMAQIESLATDGIQVAMRGDLSQETIYVNMSGKALTPDTGIDSNTWYSMDLKKVLTMSGMDMNLSELTAASRTTSLPDLVAGFLSMSDVNSVTAYNQCREVLSAFADNAFVQTDPAVPSEYTAVLEEEKGTVALVLNIVDGTVNGYSMGFQMAMSEEDGVTAGTESVSMSMSVDPQDNLKAEMSIDNGMTSMELTMEGSYRKGNRTVEVQPPAGAAVVDLTSLFGATME